ncbi:MAG: organic solvent tolerance protein OstA [Sphingobacteriia bacterium]|nr:organic solvent tolerance protein OstA [Sphingobacteriia bacterium]
MQILSLFSFNRIPKMIKKKLLTILILFVPALFPLHTAAQNKTTIQLVSAKKMVRNEIFGEEQNIFTGKVVFEHDSVLLYCDSAVFQAKSNRLNAFKNVHIYVSDTLNLYGEKLDYDGNTRIANFTDSVSLVDNDATLVTNWLIYNRNTEIAYYNANGKIFSDTNVLTSRQGYYYTQTKMLYFNKEVVLSNPTYTLKSDTLVYDTFSEIAYIAGPTEISGNNIFIYTEDGWYDTRTGKTKLVRNPLIVRLEQTMKGDSIFYDETSNAGDIYGNAFIRDTVQNIIVRGDYVKYRPKEGFAFAVERPWAIFIDKSDSLFIHADTLHMVFDSTEQARDLMAYHKCKFFREDLQGKCDSLHYKFSDSTITMKVQPAVWSKDNQITGETLKLFRSNEAIDSMYITNTAFIISADKFDESAFNQIKGKNMIAYFTGNELYKINVFGNSETIYYVREENGDLVGINKAVASHMEIRINNREVTDIFYFDKPDAILHPEGDIPPEELKLRDFYWIENNRPKNKNDIFIWSEDKPLLNR